MRLSTLLPAIVVAHANELDDSSMLQRRMAVAAHSSSTGDSCAETIHFTTNKENMVSNNLGGLGPRYDEPEEIRFQNAAEVKGQMVDLVITTNDGLYVNSDQAMEEARGKSEGDADWWNTNGARGDFGTINMVNYGKSLDGGKTFSFKFSFEDSTSKEPVQVDSTMFTFFDIDHATYIPLGETNIEQLSICGAADFDVTDQTDLTQVIGDDGCWKFGSTKPEVPNVLDWTQMTPEQKDSSVVVEIRDKSSFVVDYRLAERMKRNFLWMAHSTFSCPTTPTTTPPCKDVTIFKTNRVNLKSNNLMGLGPVADDPEEIRYSPAAKLNGRNIDLVVTVRDGAYANMDQAEALAISDVRPDYLNLNGARGDFGTIDIVSRGKRTETDTHLTHKLRFDFVDTQTGAAVTVPDVMFTFFDIDQGWQAHGTTDAEIISTCDASDHTITSDTTLTKDLSDGCMQFGSTATQVRNVLDASDMTAEQMAASVVLQFTGKTGFDLDYTTLLHSRRNFLFQASPTFICTTTTTSPCTDVTPFKTTLANLVANNLGGRGPFFDDPEEIRFQGAAKLGDDDLDLVITVRDESYINMDQTLALQKLAENPNYLNVNGARGEFGTVNMVTYGKYETFKHKLHFEFQNTQTQEPMEVPAVMFTFFDIDQSNLVPAGVVDAEKLITCDAVEHVLTKATTLTSNFANDNKCKSFGSTARQVPNVDYVEDMTAEQKAASVVLKFEKSTGFDLDYETIARSRRNFLFQAKPTFACEESSGSVGSVESGKNAEKKAANAAAAQERAESWLQKMAAKKAAFLVEQAARIAERLQVREEAASARMEQRVEASAVRKAENAKAAVLRAQAFALLREGKKEAFLDAQKIKLAQRLLDRQEAAEAREARLTIIRFEREQARLARIGVSKAKFEEMRALKVAEFEKNQAQKILERLAARKQLVEERAVYWKSLIEKRLEAKKAASALRRADFAMMREGKTAEWTKGQRVRIATRKEAKRLLKLACKARWVSIAESRRANNKMRLEARRLRFSLFRTAKVQAFEEQKEKNIDARKQTKAETKEERAAKVTDLKAARDARKAADTKARKESFAEHRVGKQSEFDWISSEKQHTRADLKVQTKKDRAAHWASLAVQRKERVRLARINRETAWLESRKQAKATWAVISAAKRDARKKNKAEKLDKKREEWAMRRAAQMEAWQKEAEARKAEWAAQRAAMEAAWLITKAGKMEARANEKAAAFEARKIAWGKARDAAQAAALREAADRRQEFEAMRTEQQQAFEIASAANQKRLATEKVARVVRRAAEWKALAVARHAAVKEAKLQREQAWAESRAAAKALWAEVKATKIALRKNNKAAALEERQTAWASARALQRKRVQEEAEARRAEFEAYRVEMMAKWKVTQANNIARLKTEKYEAYITRILEWEERRDAAQKANDEEAEERRAAFAKMRSEQQVAFQEAAKEAQEQRDADKVARQEERTAWWANLAVERKAAAKEAAEAREAAWYKSRTAAKEAWMLLKATKIAARQAEKAAAIEARQAEWAKRREAQLISWEEERQARRVCFEQMMAEQKAQWLVDQEGRIEARALEKEETREQRQRDWEAMREAAIAEQAERAAQRKAEFEAMRDQQLQLWLEIQLANQAYRAGEKADRIQERLDEILGRITARENAKAERLAKRAPLMGR